MKVFQFWGGADVTPELYGEKNTSSFTDKKQDSKDIELYLGAVAAAKEGPVLCTGICRGAQFLWGMSGGKLCQHYPGTHPDIHPVDQQDWCVTSTHHQCCIEPVPKGLEVTLTYKGVIEAFEGINIDGIYVFGFQYHPEYCKSSDPSRMWANSRIKAAAAKIGINMGDVI